MSQIPCCSEKKKFQSDNFGGGGHVPLVHLPYSPVVCRCIHRWGDPGSVDVFAQHSLLNADRIAISLPCGPSKKRLCYSLSVRILLLHDTHYAHSHCFCNTLLVCFSTNHRSACCHLHTAPARVYIASHNHSTRTDCKAAAARKNSQVPAPGQNVHYSTPCMRWSLWAHSTTRVVSFLADLGRKISSVSGDDQDSTFLFQRISVKTETTTQLHSAQSELL